MRNNQSIFMSSLALLLAASCIVTAEIEPIYVENSDRGEVLVYRLHEAALPDFGGDSSIDSEEEQASLPFIDIQDQSVGHLIQLESEDDVALFESLQIYAPGEVLTGEWILSNILVDASTVVTPRGNVFNITYENLTDTERFPAGKPDIDVDAGHDIIINIDLRHLCIFAWCPEDNDGNGSGNGNGNGNGNDGGGQCSCIDCTACCC